MQTLQSGLLLGYACMNCFMLVLLEDFVFMLSVCVYDTAVLCVFVDLLTVVSQSAPQIRLVRQLRALQVFVIHSFIHSVDAHSINVTMKTSTQNISSALQLRVNEDEKSFKSDRKCVTDVCDT